MSNENFYSVVKKYSLIVGKGILFLIMAMSLFSQIQWELIEKPKNTYNYKRILEEKKNVEDEEKKRKEEWKKLAAEKKAELPEEEFKKWRKKARYQRNKEKCIKNQLNNYYRDKELQEAMIEEIYREVYDTLPEPISRDEFYTEKFKSDDIKSNWYRFAWRSSRLKRIKWAELSRQHLPFRIYGRYRIDALIKAQEEIQTKSYKYLKEQREEIKDCKINLQKRQQPYNYPMYSVSEPLKSIADASEINNWNLILVADWMIRGKYMSSGVYLWRNSFIFWDVLVTGTWHLFRIALENNLRWLTPKTVEKIHELRIKRRKEKAEKRPPIYMVWDAYLLKIPINEWENLYYIVPT